MQQIQGKFILFDLPEFSNWLNATDVSRVINLVQNHYTWSPSYQQFDGNNHFKLLTSMENAHIERGFSEIGQNLTTFPDGTIAVCRSMDNIPAGIKGANTSAICIENLGNFDLGKDTMTDQHRDTIIRLNACLCKRFNLQPNVETIVYHHWYDLNTGERTDGTGTTKTCPGTNFFQGNSVPEAEINFIPLIQAEFQVADMVEPVETEEVLFAATTNEDELNVQDEPGSPGKRIKKLGKGILVNVYEKIGNWCRIHPTKPHWVNIKNLDQPS
jgi:hypothetical protein